VNVRGAKLGGKGEIPCRKSKELLYLRKERLNLCLKVQVGKEEFDRKIPWRIA